MQSPFEVVDGAGPIMATAIHAGHGLRPEVSARLSLAPAIRLREEDPYTDCLTDVVPLQVVVDRSRFEVDLNRPRDQAVYLRPEQAWGLEIWSERLTEAGVERSLAIHDRFYYEIAKRLDRMAESGRFVVLDLHSYNHRREGPDSAPAPIEDNPDVNLGTGTLDHDNWGSLVERFTSDLTAHLPEGATFAENVRFQGGYFSQWVNERYAGVGCALALEFKKSFMDEWSGELDEARLHRLRQALAAAVPGLIASLAEDQ